MPERVRGGSTLIFACVFALFLPAAGAQEGPKLLTPKVQEVRLFKNGVAMVRESVTLPGPGVYWLPAPPDPIHGTFGVRSSVPVSVTRTEVEAPRELDAGVVPSLTSGSLAGRTVRVHFVEEHLPSLVGVVRAAPRAWVRRDGDRMREKSWWSEWNPYGGRSSLPGSPEPTELIVAADGSQVLIPIQRIGYLEVVGGASPAPALCEALRLEVEGASEGPIEVTFDYSTHGATWSPSYELDVSDPATLVLRRRAEICNELTDWEDTEIALVSGVPNFAFQRVLSPLSPGAKLFPFIRDLSTAHLSRPSARNGNAGPASQQASPSSLGASVDAGLIDEPRSSGVDLRARSIGRRSLAAGETMHLSLGELQAPYDRVITWTHLESDNGWNAWVYPSPQDSKYPLPMESIRFRNPFEEPLTTAPALIVGQGGLGGQGLLEWMEHGEERVIPITRALSIRVTSEETEAQRGRGPDGRGNDGVDIVGTLLIENLRAEAITLYAQLELRGFLRTSDGEPHSERRSAGAGDRNPLHRLTWNLTVGAGETRELHYSYLRRR